MEGGVSFNAASLKLMQDKGLSFSDVIEIATAMESRSKSAERQARYRKRKAGDVTNVDVTRDATPPLNEDTSKPSDTPQDIPEGISPPTPDLNGKKPEIAPELLVEAWNAMADQAGVHKARLTPERRKKIRTFVKHRTIEDITEGIWAVPRSPFLCGENDRGWKADLDFFLTPSKFTKIAEGAYAG
jgi:hypothetical protein